MIHEKAGRNSLHVEGQDAGSSDSEPCGDRHTCPRKSDTQLPPLHMTVTEPQQGRPCIRAPSSLRRAWLASLGQNFHRRVGKIHTVYSTVYKVAARSRGNPGPPSQHSAGRHTRLWAWDAPAWCRHVSVRGAHYCGRAKGDTHQVHDEVQLDGEVHDEEDTGPGVPGVGGHHDVREAVCAAEGHLSLAHLRMHLAGDSCPPTPAPHSQPTPFPPLSPVCTETKDGGSGRGVMTDIPGLELGQRSVVGVAPDLLGGGQENEQVDDAVLQGVEVLQGKGGGCGQVWAVSSRAPLPLRPPNARGSRAEGPCTREPALSEPALMEGAGLPTKGVRELPGVSHVVPGRSWTPPHSLLDSPNLPNLIPEAPLRTEKGVSPRLSGKAVAQV